MSSIFEAGCRGIDRSVHPLSLISTPHRLYTLDLEIYFQSEFLFIGLIHFDTFHVE